MAEPTYEINSSLIWKVGYDPFKERMVIQFSDGKVSKNINASFEFYKKFIKAKDPDEFYFKEIHQWFFRPDTRLVT